MLASSKIRIKKASFSWLLLINQLVFFARIDNALNSLFWLASPFYLRIYSLPWLVESLLHHCVFKLPAAVRRAIVVQTNFSSKKILDSLSKACVIERIFSKFLSVLFPRRVGKLFLGWNILENKGRLKRRWINHIWENWRFCIPDLISWKHTIAVTWRRTSEDRLKDIFRVRAR